jgi:hypothetical protein
LTLFARQAARKRRGSAIADHQPKRLPCVNRFTLSEVIKV